MKLTRVQIRNFRSIEEADVILKHINWLFGANRSGKSSVLRAIRDALLASSPATVVRHGEKSSEVTVNFVTDDGEHNVRYRRFKSQTTKPELDGAPLPRGNYLDAMRDNFGISDRVLEAALDSRSFMEKDGKDQVGIVLSAGDRSFGWQAANKAFRLWCDRHQVEPFDLAPVVPTFTEQGVQLIDNIYKAAHSKRTDANRLVKEAPREPPPPPDAIQYIRDARLLQGLQAEQGKLNQRVGSIGASLKVIAELSALGSPEAELAEYPLEVMKEKASAHKKATEAYAKALRDLPPRRERLRVLQNAQDSLDSGNCPFGVACNFKADEKAWKALCDTVGEAAADLKNVSDSAPPTPSAEVEKELVTARRHHAGLRDRAKQAAALKARLVPDGTEKLQLQLETARGRIKEVARLLDLVRTYTADVAGFRVANTAYKGNLAGQAQLDHIVKAFDKEIRAEAFRQDQSKFEQLFGEALGIFFDGMSVDIDTGKKFKIAVKDEAGNSTSYVDLSESEKLLVAVSAQHAIAQIAGTGLLFIDAVDLLQGSLRNRFVRGLYAIAAKYETVVVASTIGDIDVRKSRLASGQGLFANTQLFMVGETTLGEEKVGHAGCISPV